MPRPKKTEIDRVMDELGETIKQMKKWSASCKFILAYTKNNSIESKFIGDIFRALVDNRKRLEIIQAFLMIKEERTFYMTPTGEMHEATDEQKVKMLISKMENSNFYRDAIYSEEDCLHGGGKV